MEIRKAINQVRGPYRAYDAQELTEAYQAVIDKKLPVERVAKKYGIPITTLKDRVNGRIDITTMRSGPKTVFSQEQEAYLARHLKTMAEVGYGYSRQETLNVASEYATHLGSRPKSQPLGFDWFYGFLSRWPDLKVVKPRSLEIARAKSATEGAVDRYFIELDKIMTKYNLKDKPESIFNIDEKGLSTDHKPPKIVAGNGYKAQAITSGKSKNVTLIGCVSAVGQQIPPYFIFPGQRMLDSLLDGATPGTSGTVSESGWSNSDTFFAYMKDHLTKYLPARNADSYILILYDGHRSHVSIPLIEWAMGEHVVLFVLPPHCSHLLQPLDVGCYGPLELAWNAGCHKYLRETCGKMISRYDVCRIACKSYASTLSPSTIQSAFRKSGIFPFDPSVISPAALAPSTTFPSSRPHSSTSKDAEEFLETKGGEVLKNVKAAKVRNTLSKVVGGKPITEVNIVEAVKAHVCGQKRKTDKPADNKKSLAPTKKPRKFVPPFAAASTSSVQAHKSKQMLSEDQSDSDSDIEETEKCVICKRFTPVNNNPYQMLKIVNWGQCDKCAGWVHLSTCTKVRVLRSGDTFLCPSCINN